MPFSYRRMSAVPLPEIADPLAEARTQLSVAASDDAPRAVAIIGAGLGYLTEAARERWPDAVIVVLEPRRELAHAAVARTPSLYAPGRVHVLVGPDYQGADALWKVFDAADAVSPSAGIRPTIVVNPLLAQSPPAPTAKALRVARRAIDAATMNARAREENAGRYVLNTLRNVEHIVRGPDPGCLRGLFTGVPAIVVGAGPLLDRTMDTLRAVRSRALVLATDTSWRPLVSAGIEPHLVIATDPSDANGRHLRGIDGADRTWVLAEGSVDPAALQALRGRVGIFRIAGHHPWPWLQGLGVTRDVVKAWGSVLTSAYDVAITAGCGPVVFVGADLSFTDRRPYCRGTTMEEDWARHVARGASLRRVWEDSIAARTLLNERDVRGGETVTSPHLVEFRNWIVSQARTEPDGRVVNATGGGILLGPGITQADLASTLAGRPDVDAALRGTIDRAFQSSSNAAAGARVATALRTIEPHLGEWLRFGRPRLTATDVHAAAAAGLESLDRADRPAAPTPTSGVRKPRWHAADRVALMYQQLSGEESGLDGTVARAALDAASRAAATDDAVRAADALLALQQLAIAPGEEVARGADPSMVPFSVRFDWVAPARPLVAVLEESLIGLGLCARPGLLVPVNAGDFWNGPIVAVEEQATKPAGPIGGGRAAVLAERMAIETIAVADPLLHRRQVRLVAAIIRGLADAHLRSAATSAIRVQAPASGRALALPLRVDAVMRAITGSIAAPVPGRDARLLLAADSVAYCEPRFLTHPARSPGWTLVAMDENHAVFTPKASRQSLIVDAEGDHVRGPAWPVPIAGEAPWGDEGGAIAWAHPSTLLFRPRTGAPVVSEDVPFSARQFSIGPDGSAYWLEASGALWEWLPGGARRFVLFAPCAGYVRHEGRDLVLAPVARDAHGGVVRRRAAHEWQCDGSPHARRQIAAAPEGQCSKVAEGPWTARAYPFSDLVRLEDGTGRAWLLACYAAFGVAWAGPSLLVTTQEGRLLMFERLAERLETLGAGPALAQTTAARGM